MVLERKRVELRNELTWHVDFEADQLVGPVAALVEQNAIELDLRNVCRRKATKWRYGPMVGESDRGTVGVEWAINPFGKVISMRVLGE